MLTNWIRIGYLATSLLALPCTAADNYPDRPIRVLAGGAAGGPIDIMGRVVGQKLSDVLGQSIVIDNRGGAGGNIGGALVARAQPDGYTLLLATTGPAATNKLMYKDLSYDPQRDLAPVMLVGKSPVIIVARPDAPFRTLAEMIDYAKANPDKLNAGFPGNGTLGHITGELLKDRTHITFGQVQYRGSTPIMTDLIGGHIDVAMDSMAVYVPNVKDGRLRALAIAGAKRWSALPDVATVSESGLPGFEASVWYALLAPNGTPPDIVAKLNAAANEFLASDRAKETFGNLGIEMAGGSPDDLRTFICAEIAKWGPIVRAANIAF